MPLPRHLRFRRKRRDRPSKFTEGAQYILRLLHSCLPCIFGSSVEVIPFKPNQMGTDGIRIENGKAEKIQKPFQEEEVKVLSDDDTSSEDISEPPLESESQAIPLEFFEDEVEYDVLIPNQQPYEAWVTKSGDDIESDPDTVSSCAQDILEIHPSHCDETRLQDLSGTESSDTCSTLSSRPLTPLKSNQYGQVGTRFHQFKHLRDVRSQDIQTKRIVGITANGDLPAITAQYSKEAMTEIDNVLLGTGRRRSNKSPDDEPEVEPVIEQPPIPRPQGRGDPYKYGLHFLETPCTPPDIKPNDEVGHRCSVTDLREKLKERRRQNGSDRETMHQKNESYYARRKKQLKERAAGFWAISRHNRVEPMVTDYEPVEKAYADVKKKKKRSKTPKSHSKAHDQPEMVVEDLDFP